MPKNQDGFNLDDMLEIFGDGPQAPPPAAAPAPVASSRGAAQLTPEEEALLRDFESRKAAPPPPPAPAEDEERLLEAYERERAQRRAAAGDSVTDIEAAENGAFCEMLEETRGLTLAYLEPLIGARAALLMLAKSVERARSRAPEVLRDANWTMDGTLREDGSVDPERLGRNALALAPATRVDDYLGGLRELVGLRLRAVENGLGAEAAATLRARLVAARPGLLKRGFPPAWVALFYAKVLDLG